MIDVTNGTTVVKNEVTSSINHSHEVYSSMKDKHNIIDLLISKESKVFYPDLPLVDSIAYWFNIGKDGFTNSDIIVQLGCNVEEDSELFLALAKSLQTDEDKANDNRLWNTRSSRLHDYLESYASIVKGSAKSFDENSLIPEDKKELIKEDLAKNYFNIDKIQSDVELKTELVDALVDGIVTRIGLLETLGVNPSIALQAVNYSNWSKFDGNGMPTFDENGKRKKGDSYINAENLLRELVEKKVITSLADKL